MKPQWKFDHLLHVERPKDVGRLGEVRHGHEAPNETLSLFCTKSLLQILLGCCNATPKIVAMPCSALPLRPGKVTGWCSSLVLMLLMPCTCHNPKPRWPISPVLSVLRQAVGTVYGWEPPIWSQLPVTMIRTMYACMYVRMSLSNVYVCIYVCATTGAGLIG